jgi:hypothetical protein
LLLNRNCKVDLGILYFFAVAFLAIPNRISVKATSKFARL